MNGLNPEQQWHLEKEGLEARVRNQLSPFVSLLSLAEAYRDIEQDKKGGILTLIQDTFKSATDSFTHLKNLSIETSKEQLGAEIDKLGSLLETVEDFVANKNESAIDLIVNNQDLYTAILQKSIELSKD